MSVSVLIVEDDPMVAEINRQVIEKVPPFKVVGISSAENDAIKRIAKLKPDLILLDIYLPHGNGLNVLKYARQSNLQADVILVTASKDATTIHSTLRHGAFDYIIKPFDLERLKKALKNYMQLRNILNKKEEINQSDLDRISINVDNEADDELDGSKLPKGVHLLTLEQILAILLKEKKPLTSQEISSKISMSKITVWRYLEYLVEQNKIKYKLTYGSTGRPSKKYYLEPN